MAEYESYLTVTINIDWQIVKKLIGLNMLWENTLATRLTEEYFIIFEPIFVFKNFSFNTRENSRFGKLFCYNSHLEQVDYKYNINAIR